MEVAYQFVDQARPHPRRCFQVAIRQVGVDANAPNHPDRQPYYHPIKKLAMVWVSLPTMVIVDVLAVVLAKGVSTPKLPPF